MDESGLEYAPIEDTGDREWFGYKYLGPGTDVYGKVSRGVQAVNALDAAARKHDISYYNISNKYRRGLISRSKAIKEIEKADLKLFGRSYLEHLKNVPGLAYSLATGDVKGAIKKGLVSVPAGYTAAAMLGKWGLSKLGIWKGGFANLRRSSKRPIPAFVPSKNIWPKYE